MNGMLAKTRKTPGLYAIPIDLMLDRKSISLPIMLQMAFATNAHIIQPTITVLNETRTGYILWSPPEGTGLLPEYWTQIDRDTPVTATEPREWRTSSALDRNAGYMDESSVAALKPYSTNDGLLGCWGLLSGSFGLGDFFVLFVMTIRLVWENANSVNFLGYIIPLQVILFKSTLPLSLKRYI